jgi:hypothetical protein
MPSHVASPPEALLDRVIEDAKAARNLSEEDLAAIAKRRQLAPNKLSLLIDFATKIARALAPGEKPKGLLEARRKANVSRKALIAKGDIVGSAQLTAALGITRQGLNKSLHARRIFALELGGEQYYPVFYADPQFDRRKLEKVSQALGDLPGWSKWQFFTTPKVSLGRITPLQALAKGSYEEVLRTAQGFAER